MMTDTLETLIAGFEDCTYPATDWDHAAHLKMALYYLYHHEEAEAIRRIREGIQRYNNHHGGDGYHETLTMAWIRIVQDYLHTAAPASLETLAEGVVAYGADTALPLRYYSKERLYSAEAKAHWVEPDLLQMANAE